MNREELEKEAVRKSLSYNTKYSEDGDLKDMLSRPQDFIEGSIAGMVDLLRKKAYRDGMVDGAEPRERQIQIDAEQIRTLQKQNGELTDKVKELEAQIEKMKIKWHDLEKDPNDLPKETGSYVVSRFANYLKRKKVSQTLFFIKGKGWQTKMDKTQIIAWCEIPQFN